MWVVKRGFDTNVHTSRRMVRAVALFAGCAAGLPLAAGFGSAPPMGSLMRSRPVSHRPMRRASPTTMVATPLEQPKVKIPDYTGWTDLSQVRAAEP